MNTATTQIEMMDSTMAWRFERYLKDFLNQTWTKVEVRPGRFLLTNKAGQVRDQNQILPYDITFYKRVPCD